MRNLGNIYNMNKGNKSIAKIPLHHIKLSHQMTIKNLKVDHHTGGRWFIHDSKHRKEDQLLSLEHPCCLS